MFKYQIFRELWNIRVGLVFVSNYLIEVRVRLLAPTSGFSWRV